LADVADGLVVTDPNGAASLARSLEEVVSAAHEFAELRLAHVVSTGMTMLGPEDAERVVRLAAPGRLEDRLGMASMPGVDGTRTRLLAEIEHWRTMAANPAFDPVTVEACDIAARCAEGLYVSLGQ
jgi:hypothetical protein